MLVASALVLCSCVLSINASHAVTEQLKRRSTMQVPALNLRAEPDTSTYTNAEGTRHPGLRLALYWHPCQSSTVAIRQRAPGRRGAGGLGVVHRRKAGHVRHGLKLPSAPGLSRVWGRSSRRACAPCIPPAATSKYAYQACFTPSLTEALQLTEHSEPILAELHCERAEHAPATQRCSVGDLTMVQGIPPWFGNEQTSEALRWRSQKMTYPSSS